jgi:UDP-N-acetylmuramate: L-alanyl-gamma-D-glutamyl-meso-diaminopimelate ligase
VNGDESVLQEVIQKGAWSPIEYFGNQGQDATWSFEGLENDNFIVKKLGEPVAKVEWDILANVAGRHNQMNALAAIAAAEHVGISPEASAKALGSFKNVKRRLELVGKVNDIAVYDDFAHHPTAIATTIDGLRRRIRSQRLIAVLEPRSNTMKLGVMKQQLPNSLVQADLVFAYGAKEGKSALGWDLQEAMMPMGQKAKAFDQLDTLVNAIQAIAQPGDHILVMSNGGFGGVHQQLLKALA